MDTYDFFLFSKLFDVVTQNNVCYDELYPITCVRYEKFTEQDNGSRSLYDAMYNYLLNNKETIKQELMPYESRS